MRGANRRRTCECQGHRVAQPAVGQPGLPTGNGNGWKEARNRGAGTHDLVQPRTAIESCCEVTRFVRGHIMTDDPEMLHTMMEPLEARRFELPEPMWNHTTPASQTTLTAVPEMDVEAIGQEVSTAKPLGIIN